MNLLNELLKVIDSLLNDLKRATHLSLTLNEWSQYLECLYTTYFSVRDLDDSYQDEENSLIDAIRSLISDVPFLSSKEFGFISLLEHLTTLLQKKSSSMREKNLQVVRFTSMHPSFSMPKDIIALIGMDEDSYPEKTSFNSLDYLHKKNADSLPERVDYDRYLFLETLISTKKYLLLSYVGYKGQNTTLRPYSSLVDELIQYIDHNFTLNGYLPSLMLIFNHPFDYHSENYFQEDTHFYSYIRSHYQIANNLNTNSQNEVRQFFQIITAEAANDAIHDLEDDIVIDLKDLRSFLKDSIKYYTQKVLGIYLDRAENRQIQDDDNFILSPIVKWQLQKQNMMQNKDELFFEADKMGVLPPGVFKQAAYHRFSSDDDSIEKAFMKLGIQRDEIVHLLLSEEGASGLFVNDDIKQIKPIQFEIKNGVQFTIKGSLEHISKKGLICNCKSNIKDLWPYLADILVYQKICNRENLCILDEDGKTDFSDSPREYKKCGLTTIVTLKSKRKTLFTLQDKGNNDDLKNLTYAYLAGITAPLAIIPELTKPISERNKSQFLIEFSKLKDLTNKSSSGIYLRWLFDENVDLDADQWIDATCPYVQPLYNLASQILLNAKEV